MTILPPEISERDLMYDSYLPLSYIPFYGGVKDTHNWDLRCVLLWLLGLKLYVTVATGIEGVC